MGENEKIHSELKIAVEKKLCIIVVKGSKFADQLVGWIRNPSSCDFSSYEEILANGWFYLIEKNSSEDIAAFIHYLLVSPPEEKPVFPE